MIDAGTKNGEMRLAPRATNSACVSSIIGRPPMPEPHEAANALGLLFAERVVRGQPCVAHGLNGGGQTVVDERIHVAGVLGREIVLDLETLHFAREPAGKGGRIKLGDVGNAGAPRKHVAPGFPDGVTDRADEAEPGDDNSTACHGLGCTESSRRANGGTEAQAAFWCLTA